MIICSKCGFENEDSDAFCGSCASFLEWDGQKVQAAEPAGTPEPEPEPEPESTRVGIIDRVKEVIGIGDDADRAAGVGTTGPSEPEATTAPEPEPEAAPVPTPGAVSAPLPAGSGPSSATATPAWRDAPAAPPAPSGTAAPSPAARVGGGEPTPGPGPAPAPAPAPEGPATAAPVAAAPAVAASAASGLSAPGAPVRTAPPSPPSDAATPGAVAPGAMQPQAVKPAATKTRPVAKKAPSTREINPGDKVCGQCGEGNDPARKFCRRCGASLVEAQVFHLPWYKAWWRRLTTKKTKQAGDRPKMRRRAIGGHGGWLSSWVLRIILLAIIVLVVLAFVGPYHHSLQSRAKRYYHDIKGDVNPTYKQFFAHTASASTEAPGHPAINAIDGERNTSWQSNGTVTGQSLVVTFAQASNIAKIGFHIGDQDSPQSYQTEPRPHKVEIVFTGQSHATHTLELSDTANFQTFNLSDTGATGFTLNVESVYPATGPGQNVSIAEIEFFTKSS